MPASRQPHGLRLIAWALCALAISVPQLASSQEAPLCGEVFCYASPCYYLKNAACGGADGTTCTSDGPGVMIAAGGAPVCLPDDTACTAMVCDGNGNAVPQGWDTATTASTSSPSASPSPSPAADVSTNMVGVIAGNTAVIAVYRITGVGVTPWTVSNTNRLLGGLSILTAGIASPRITDTANLQARRRLQAFYHVMDAPTNTSAAVKVEFDLNSAEEAVGVLSTLQSVEASGDLETFINGNTNSQSSEPWAIKSSSLFTSKPSPVTGPVTGKGMSKSALLGIVLGSIAGVILGGAITAGVILLVVHRSNAKKLSQAAVVSTAPVPAGALPGYKAPEIYPPPGSNVPTPDPMLKSFSRPSKSPKASKGVDVTAATGTLPRGNKDDDKSPV